MHWLYNLSISLTIYLVIFYIFFIPFFFLISYTLSDQDVVAMLSTILFLHFLIILCMF